MSRGGLGGGAAAAERERFENVTARMERGTESLLHSKQTLAETEEIALGITEQLASNRQTIMLAHGKPADPQNRRMRAAWSQTCFCAGAIRRVRPLRTQHIFIDLLLNW